ncbi:hypothetical protein PRIPAC_70044 [Pristionchus pacificus]|uniref:Major sperm protein n=1 Tax=Pristionchus pacificus TaxID=54126 RepID=A0A2A6BG24_PRIPA|nr:hypothetical protein PRIPAC_70044 [Pristionchus pacificus]|eukprot:PDM64832.1 MSP domain-containing protein [Pristionchus pacificus]
MIIARGKRGFVSLLFFISTPSLHTHRSAMSAAIRKRGSTLSTTDVAALGWVGVCAYLYNGQHAQLACHLASVVPPAFFSYLLIIDRKTTHEGMRSLLFFWFLQGMLLCLDTMMGEVKGFYFGKFLVLSGMFWKAVKDNNYGYGKGDKTVTLLSCGVVSTDGVAMSEQRSEIFERDWPTESTQGARSMQARRDLDDASTIVATKRSAVTAMPPSALASPLSAGGLPSVNTATGRDFDALSTYTCSSFRPPASFVFPSPPSNLLHTPLAALRPHYSPPLSSGRALLDKNPLPGVDLRDMSPRFPYGKLNDDFSLGDAPVSETQSVMIGRDDLMTDPTGFIVIPGPHERVHLQVQNTTGKVAMFGLKCNAMERIKATPTAGVIPSGETISIRLSLNENVNWPSLMGERWDKLAIDYHLCEDPTVTQFDKFTFFAERNSKYRVKFNVIYRTEAGPVHGY